jgi:hypothetical protein
METQITQKNQKVPGVVNIWINLKIFLLFKISMIKHLKKKITCFVNFITNEEVKHTLIIP